MRSRLPAKASGGVTLALALVVSWLPEPARAEDIPAFARKYNVSCQLCHNPIPTLTEFGETFAGNGFRFAPEEPRRDTINTGDPLLELVENVPLAFRFDGYLQTFTNGDAQADFEIPYNLKILSGGPIVSNISYYLYFFFAERGEVAGIEDAYIYVNDIMDAPLDVALGQFQVSDPLFKRELRLEFEDYAIYRARIGDQPADLTYDRGVTVVTELAETTLTGIVVNGNGKGEAGEDRRFDNDARKSFFAHARRSIIPQLTLGLMGYYGGQKATLASGAEVDNDLWMVGADVIVSAGPVEVNAQYVHREDDTPTFTVGEPTAETDGGFVEAIYRPPGRRWYALALYNRVDSSEPLLDVRLGGPADIERYETLTGHLGYVLRRNFRVLAEATWDMELESARWTLGLVTAF